MPGAYLLQGDAQAIPLADGSVQCVVTSPPYWGLRDYGHNGQLGLEATPAEYVAHLVTVFRDVRRVLRADGTCWLNLGDSYAGSSMSGDIGSGTIAGTQQGALKGQDLRFNGVRALAGLKPKDLVGIPWRVAFALQADGWRLRSDIIWAKPNPMPESITDRPTKAHEYLFLLTKSARYYYDGEAIKEPSIDPPGVSRGGSMSTFGRGEQLISANAHRGEEIYRSNGVRNRRSVWTIAPEPYPAAHFATFPEKLVEPCILAGTSERGACPTCGAPWRRVEHRIPGDTEAADRPKRTAGMWHPTSTLSLSNRGDEGSREWALRGSRVQTLGWTPACACDARVRCGDIDPPSPVVPCRVLDPFAGSGTTVAVAERLGRVGIGLELKPAYLALAKRRTVQMGLL